MAIEIERKFLTRSDAWREHAHAVIEMAQGYLNDAAALDQGRQRCSIRVRLEGDQARLNIKSAEVGLRRQEFDYPIPLEDARALMQLSVGAVLHKRRHLLRHGDHLWEIDEFLGENLGLVVAEVELSAEDEKIALPPWLGQEVTELPRYYNLNLGSHPYSRWSQAERDALDAMDRSTP